MKPKKTEGRVAPGWTFLSNHAHVLLCLAQDPEMLLRDVAERVGITERAVQRIVAELEEGRYLERIRSGRRNRYKMHPELPLRHPIEAHRDVGALLALVRDTEESGAGGEDGREAEALPPKRGRRGPKKAPP